VGKPYDEAAATLEDLGLKVNKAQKLSQEESDTVLSVDPSTLAKAGDTITLTVSYSFFDFDFNRDDDDRDRGKKRDDD
jgi:beta-lactam-binding protein with PASTA domain